MTCLWYSSTHICFSGLRTTLFCDECDIVIDQSVPVLGVKDAAGIICYCTSELCNAAPQTAAGRMVLGSTLASLLTLLATRCLNQ